MNNHNVESATLAGGCFWCLEAIFERVRGVARIESGYLGGHTAQPSYQQVCAETTGHAEAVQVTFDPHIISYREILDVFFVIHDPTTLNRQGHDVGTRYRSVIFYHNPKQHSIAKEAIDVLNKSRIWNGPIVTEICSLAEFYPAEGYHQQYYQRNGDQPYCQIVISPKLSKFRKEHSDKLNPTPSVQSRH